MKTLNLGLGEVFRRPTWRTWTWMAVGLSLGLAGGALGQETAPAPPRAVATPPAIEGTPRPTPIREIQENGWKVKFYPRDRRRIVPPGPVQGSESATAVNVPGMPTETPNATPTPSPTPSDPEKTFVAMVDGRRMSRAELDRRAAEPLKRMRSLMKTEPGSVEFQEARARQEGSIVQDWVYRKLLAEEANRRGILLSQGEFDSRYQALVATAAGKQEYENTMKVLGMTEGEIRAELFDDMLGEKTVEQELKKYDTNEYLRPIYEKAPNLFMRPEQVHALHYSVTLEGTEGTADLRKVRENLEAIRKRIAKGESPSAIAEEEGGKALGVFGLDLGWVDPTIQSLPPEVQKAVGKLKKGETSAVILSKDLSGKPRAFHIVKVVDQRDAAGGTYESAKPLMLENLKESVRTGLVEELRKSGAHVVFVNLSGIPPDRLEAALQGRAGVTPALPLRSQAGPNRAPAPAAVSP